MTTKAHGFFDFTAGALLVVMPLAAGRAGEVAGVTLVAAGLALVLAALVTDFEAGIIRRLQVALHLWIDGIIGLLLALSPWLLTFYQTLWIPHVLFGITLMAIAFFTDTVPGYERRRSDSLTT